MKKPFKNRIPGQPKRQEYLLKKVPGCLLATE